MNKGAKIDCVAHFDNSAANLGNPDPTKPVRWGDQTWEEMMIGWVNYMWEEPQENEAIPAKSKASGEKNSTQVDGN